jgi:hypothetical protein
MVNGQPTLVYAPKNGMRFASSVGSSTIAGLGIGLAGITLGGALAVIGGGVVATGVGAAAVAAAPWVALGILGVAIGTITYDVFAHAVEKLKEETKADTTPITTTESPFPDCNEGPKEDPLSKAIEEFTKSLPDSPEDLLGRGWEETTSPMSPSRRTFVDPKTRLKVEFDPGRSGESGWRGKDHWHLNNPNATNRHNQYLDANGNPCGRGSKDSHL